MSKTREVQGFFKISIFLKMATILQKNCIFALKFTYKNINYIFVLKIMYKVLIKKFSIFQKKPIFFFAECIKEYSIKISSKSDEN